MKILAIVCPVTRHLYTLNKICERTKLDGVIFQHRTRKSVEREMTDKEAVLNNIHFRLRDKAEEKWLGEGAKKEICRSNVSNIIDVYNNSLDLKEVDDFVSKINPDILLTIGCGLIKDEILKSVKFGLNFHLGMSPRYKGSAGLYWPIYNMDPERIAVSILVLENNIDGGPIVHHSRPNIDVKDTIQDIAAKTIIQGADDFSKIITVLANGGELAAKEQKSEGRVHYESAYHPRHLLVTNYLMSNGLIRDYLDNKMERDKHVALVKYPHI